MGLPTWQGPSLAERVAQLRALVRKLQTAAAYVDKLDLLFQEDSVRRFFNGTRQGSVVRRALERLTPKDAFCLACLPAIGQEHVLSTLPEEPDVEERLGHLAHRLSHVEDFYDSIGGLGGYQLQCLMLLPDAAAGGSATATAPAAGGATFSSCAFLDPVGLDLADPEQKGAAAAAVRAGLEALPHMAEIYPLGGAGDRLGLVCERTGEALPTAVLPYCGRSLLESLVRDLQAREHLFWKVHGKQHTTPVAIMTSAAKGNNRHVKELFEQAHWFGRGSSSFKLFKQPLVPVLASKEGAWLLPKPLAPAMKPGGHGVIWKLMLDEGVFSWLERSGREAAIVRQISNPMAGMDSTLLALAGVGHSGRRTFGFASCERAVGAAEGMNVLMETQATDVHGSLAYDYQVTNIEYTEFERLGITDSAAAEGSAHSKFPANTNVLYVGLGAAERAVRASVAEGRTDAVLPGMILNLSKAVTYSDAAARGAHRTLQAGRLECTMQNLADCLSERRPERLASEADRAALSTFVVFNKRRKVTSSAKRKRAPGSTAIHQTPDGSFYSLMENARDLLLRCGFDVPKVGSVSSYLSQGPGFVFVYHPALGPLWELITQKLRRGRLAPGSELQLEVAEASLEDVEVQGSLLVVADSPLGKMRLGGAEPQLQYSDACGRVRLSGVRVNNRGVDWGCLANLYWKHQLTRWEACRVVLHGRSEFDAAGVELTGNLTYEVPHGCRMVVRPGPDGQPAARLERLDAPSWRWRYRLAPNGTIELDLEELLGVAWKPSD